MQPRSPLATWKPSPNYTRGRASVRAVVLHITQGNDSVGWLRNPASQVSSHLYIDRDGSAAQLVEFTDTAWTNGLIYRAGKWYTPGNKPVTPTWPRIRPGINPNSDTITIELEGFSGSPLTPQQTATLDRVLVWLAQMLDWASYVPHETLIGHDQINPRDKGFCPGTSVDRAAIAARVNLHLIPPPSLPVTADAPILSAPRCSLEQARALFRRHAPHNGYTEADVALVILPAYFNACAPLGLDPAVAVAQMAHETDWMRSFWSARPQRNPGGIGVNGEAYPHKPANASGFRYNAQRRMWERGLSFGGWLSDSIPAHLGRLLAYVLPPGHGTAEQRAAVNRALAYRPLPEVVRGSAQTLKALGRVHNPSGVGWASPGDRYGEALAKVINEMRAQ